MTTRSSFARHSFAILLTCCFLICTNLHAQTSPAVMAYVTQLAETTYSAHVLALQAFGTRHALQPNRDGVTSWLDTKFRSFGFTDVAYDSFTSGTSQQRNVIATLAGSQSSAGEIVICAHYDSYTSPATAAPGADDNASGTAAVLEMARILKVNGYVPKRTIRFIAFGAEELGLVGSAHYATSAYAAKRAIDQVQNYDMIAYCPAGAARQINVIWYDNARDLAERDSSVIRRYTTLTPVLSTSYRSQSDSYPFASRGYKAFFNIEATLTPDYHTAHDSTTRLNMGFASEVARSGLALLLETDGALTSFDQVTTTLPSAVRLEQNYPNPFNGQTVIRYALAETAPVRVVVIDLLGREIAVLQDGEQAVGMHEVQWDAASVASGVYLCRLTSGGTSASRKLVLMR